MPWTNTRVFNWGQTRDPESIPEQVMSKKISKRCVTFHAHKALTPVRTHSGLCTSGSLLHVLLSSITSPLTASYLTRTLVHLIPLASASVIRLRLLLFIRSPSIVSAFHSILLYIVLADHLLLPDSVSVPPLLMSWLLLSGLRLQFWYLVTLPITTLSSIYSVCSSLIVRSFQPDFWPLTSDLRLRLLLDFLPLAWLLLLAWLLSCLVLSLAYLLTHCLLRYKLRFSCLF